MNFYTPCLCEYYYQHGEETYFENISCFHLGEKLFTICIGMGILGTFIWIGFTLYYVIGAIYSKNPIHFTHFFKVQYNI